MTNSIDSFNYRIKAIDGTQAVNIFNFDQQKQTLQSQGRKLKSDELFARPPHLYPVNKMAQQKSKGVGVEYAAKPSRTMFEPAVWTEVRQHDGNLNCNKESKPARKTANLPSMKESTSQFASVNAKTVSIDRPMSLEQASGPQSGAATPLGRGARRSSDLQSPLKMWKKMNEQNWQRIK